MTASIVVGWLVLSGLVARRAWAIRRDAREALSPLTIIHCGFFALYVVSYLALDPTDRTYYLSADGYLVLLAVAGLSALAFEVGFRARRRRPLPPPPQSATVWARGAFGLVGVAAVGLAAFLARSGGFLEIYGSEHAAGAAWATTSAYLYDLPLLIFPALLLLWGLRATNALGWPGRVLLGLVVAGVILDAWWTGSRGDWLRLLIIGATVRVCLGQRPVSRVALLGAIAALLGLVVLTPYIRWATHLRAEDHLPTVVSDVLEEMNPLSGSTPGEGNELLYAAALVASARTTGTLEYGWRWTYPAVGLVPRALWPEKPYVADWGVNYPYLVWVGEGWRVAHGAAPTGVADAFVQLGWLSPLVWLPLGVWAGNSWRRARATRTIAAVGTVCGVSIALVFAISQELVQGFNVWLPFAAPLWVVTRYGRVRQIVAQALRPQAQRARTAL